MSCATGNDSSVCVRDTEDCCSPFYLNNHLKDTVVEPQLNEYLMREFTDGIDNTLPQVQQLIECKFNLFQVNYTFVSVGTPLGFNLEYVYSLI